jgi:antitoxin HigA-1
MQVRNELRLRITTMSEKKPPRRIRTHPGEVLREEFVKPYELSARELGEFLKIPSNRLTEIMAERRGVTADTALRLSHFFGTTPEFWMNLQAAHDLSKAEAEADYSKIRSVKATSHAA